MMRFIDVLVLGVMIFVEERVLLRPRRRKRLRS
jgi:hypothetical protein